MLVWTRFTFELRSAVAASAALAAARGCDEIAIEHLLLVVISNPQSAAALILGRSGVPVANLIDQLRLSAPRGDSLRQRAAKFSAAALHLFDVAAGAADRLSHRTIGSAHIAIAITIVTNNCANAFTQQHGFDQAKAEAQAREWRNRDPFERTKPPSFWQRACAQLPEWASRAAKFPVLGWKVYVQRSLGHPGFVADPYPLYRWLQKNAPVRRDPIAPVWVVTRHADVSMLLKDPRFHKDPFAANRLPAMVREQLGIPDSEVRTADVEVLSMLFLDPPQHTRVRSVFSRAFTPKMINGLAPRIQQITEKRLEKVESAGRMDLISAIAYPLPVIVIAELLGFPPEDYPLYKKWSDDFAAALGLNPSAEQQDAAASSREELREYFNRLVVTLGDKPGENLLTVLLEMENENGGLSREEIFINSALLLAAGHETTTNLIANGLWHLLQRPEQVRQLKSDPSLIESAVEELLRFDSPVQWVSRVAGSGIEMGGVTLPVGAIVLGCIGAANRDPTVFTNADQIELARTDNKHLAFGSGIHFCLGAALARVEARIAIERILRRLPNLRLAKQKIKWKKGLIFRAIEKLEVEFDPQTRQ